MTSLHGHSCAHRLTFAGTSRTEQHGNGTALLFRALSAIVGDTTKLLNLDFDSTQPTAKSNISNSESEGLRAFLGQCYLT